MITISQIILIGALLGLDWQPIDANKLINQYPTVYDGLPNQNKFDIILQRVYVNQNPPPEWVVDHEYQHIAYWLIDNKDDWFFGLNADFVQLANSDHSVAVTASAIMYSFPYDYLHWNHYLLAQVQRRRWQLPDWYSNKWYSWLKSKHTTFIPNVEIKR